MSYITVKSPSPRLRRAPQINRMPCEHVLAGLMRDAARRENLNLRRDYPASEGSHERGRKGGLKRVGNMTIARQVLELMADGKRRSTVEVANAIGITTKSAGRALEDHATRGTMKRVGVADAGNGGRKAVVWVAE